MGVPKVPIFSAPLHGRKLTPTAWRKIETLLDTWKGEVLQAAKRHPAKSYKLGVAQIEAYSDLLTGMRSATAETAFGGIGPTMRHAEQWMRTYTLRELDDCLNVYVGRIKDALLYGLRHGLNPVEVASMMFDATQDAQVNWRLIARTEMVRANAMGRLHAIGEMGYDQVWAPPHVGACNACKRLLENRVFALADVINASNFGKPPAEWVPCIPLHPQCRHAWLPYDPEVHGLAMEHYGRLEAAGLTDESRLAEMFDESGQLADGYTVADVDPDQILGKTMEPFAEVLAYAIETVRKTRRGHTPAPARKMVVPIDQLRVDLYQREEDPAKTLSMLTALRRGEQLPPPKVSLRDDGTFWVMDGQHRVAARRLHGERQVVCWVEEGLGWDEESRLCRDAIAKTWNAWSAPLPEFEVPDITKVATLAAAVDAGNTAEEYSEEYSSPARVLDPLVWDGARLRDEVALAVDTWWSTVAGPDWRAWSHVYVPAHVHVEPIRVVVDYPALRAARREYSKLADEDLHFALVAAVRNAGRAVRELAPGIPMDVRIEPDQLIHDRPAWEWHLGGQRWRDLAPEHLEKTADTRMPDYRWSATLPARVEARLLGSDEYEGWVAKADVGAFRDELRARLGTVGYHVAPTAAREAILEHGLIEAQPNERWARYGAAKEPAGVYVWTSRARAMKWAADMARLVGGAALARNDVWQIDLAGLESQTHTDPVLGDQGAVYLTVPSVAPERLTLDATKTEAELLDVVKDAEAAAGAGVEHWITIHPNGDEAKGQPVLVRNNSDGTMSVIGGAGGNLNYLRLDPSRRVDKPKATGDDPRSKDLGSSSMDAPVSEEEAERAAAEREQEVGDARDALATAREHQQAAEQRLHDFAKDELGIDLSEATPKERRKLLAKLRVSAARTLSYGEVTARDRADSPDPDQLGEGAPRPQTDEELAEFEHQVASDASPEAEDGITRPARPSMAMTAEHAAALLDHFGDIRAIQRMASTHRRVIAGEKAPSDANQIDWSLGGQDARDERRAKALEAFARTDLARDLLGRGDAQFKGAKGYDQRYRQSFLQGGYDSIDSFSHSILGHNLLSRAGHDLLGVAGAAQLAAHAIQQEAGRDVKKVTEALKAHTDEQERTVAERGLGRVKRAADLATTARLELAKSERGEGLFTTTMARSMASEKVQEAKRGLGMMIGGLEACSALKSALERPQGAKIKVGGFSSPAQVKEAAARAGVKLTARDIVRGGAGNYSLHIEPDRLMGLVQPDKQADAGLRDRLRSIRTGQGLDTEIEGARRTPGMADTLDANQAKGKLALLAAGSHLLGFDPGVGKTHTAIAAAMEKMAREPGKHRAIIVAPTNMLDSWGDTIKAQGSGHTVDVVDKGSSKNKLATLTGNADFTVVSYETLKGYRKDLQRSAAAGEHVPHSIVITDELQKAKNDDTANYAGVESAIDMAVAHHGPSEPDAKGASFYGLTGTPIEKDVSDLNSMRNLVARARGGKGMDKKTARRQQGKLGQDEHIARGDKVAQFRDGLDADLFRLSASDAGNDLATPKRTDHQAPLTPEHEESFKARVGQINAQISDYHARSEKNGGDGGGTMPAFGGRAALMDELYGREDSNLVKTTADTIAKSSTFDFPGAPADHPEGNYSKGDHAGTYEHKHVVFGSNETSKALFGKGWNKPGATPGGLHKELESRGVKVFVGHGSMSNAQNTANYQAFLAHGGKAVFLTNDKNNAGISLQFGDNRGSFQHGATQMHHFTEPINNATIQQREARILRKGAWATPEYHRYSAGTPLELRMRETLEREARTQDLAANAEQRVAGSDTLRHKLSDAKVKTPAS